MSDTEEEDLRKLFNKTWRNYSAVTNGVIQVANSVDFVRTLFSDLAL